MAAKRLRIVLVAEESAGVQVLRLLSRAGHRVMAVLTSLGGGGSKLASVAAVARQLGLYILPSILVKDSGFSEEIVKAGVDLLLNVHSLYIIDKTILAAPAIGSFNLHPGPLPEYAGLNAPSWAVYNREQSYGVTVHWMTAGVDTGAIAYQERFGIGERDTGFTVSARCVRVGVPLIERLLQDAAAGRIPAVQQDVSLRRVYRLRDIPLEGRVDWARSASEIDSLVRAADYYPFASPWGHPRASLDGIELGVVKVELSDLPCRDSPGTVRQIDGEIAVATKDRWIKLRLVCVDGQYGDPARLPLGASAKKLD